MDLARNLVEAVQAGSSVARPRVHLGRERSVRRADVGEDALDLSSRRSVHIDHLAVVLAPLALIGGEIHAAEDVFVDPIPDVPLGDVPPGLGLYFRHQRQQALLHPVSYTHLDVYKRQVECWSSLWTERAITYLSLIHI